MKTNAIPTIQAAAATTKRSLPRIPHIPIGRIVPSIGGEGAKRLSLHLLPFAATTGALALADSQLPGWKERSAIKAEAAGAGRSTGLVLSSGDLRLVTGIAGGFTTLTGALIQAERYKPGWSPVLTIGLGVLGGLAATSALAGARHVRDAVSNGQQIDDTGQVADADRSAAPTDRQIAESRANRGANGDGQEPVSQTPRPPGPTPRQLAGDYFAAFDRDAAGRREAISLDATIDLYRDERAVPVGEPSEQLVATAMPLFATADAAGNGDSRLTRRELVRALRVADNQPQDGVLEAAELDDLSARLGLLRGLVGEGEHSLPAAGPYPYSSFSDWANTYAPDAPRPEVQPLDPERAGEMLSIVGEYNHLFSSNEQLTQFVERVTRGEQSVEDVDQLLTVTNDYSHTFTDNDAINAFLLGVLEGTRSVDELE